ncbi:hypothetical protein BB560_006150 [Smittium megazygosporum]|uniref:Uncharacterized protein n=1 Tax=Smittium megazygosporum TaxID=133381 RepID=A0A2T9YFF6_9FUNG|nr:hypothetical protein BB560_006150 [Smittium megazygosporum]
MSFACNIILSGPRIPFSTQSSYIQSDFAKRFLSVAHQISCGDATSLFNYCIFRSHQEKPIRKALVGSYIESAELPLFENIRKMHSACKSRPGTSSSVLALVSKVYTIEQLKDFGFEFSSNQYSLSRKKASDENFTQLGYERHTPVLKKKFSDKTKTKLSEILHEFSNISSSTIGSEKIKKNSSAETTTSSESLTQFSLCPHFKNTDYLYSVCFELPRIFPSKKFKLNYFMENHGKSDVGGYFGVLSRWFKEIERNRHLPSIEDLVSAFREKTQVSENIPDNSQVYHFQIYRKDAIRGLRIRAKVSSGFRNYLSFYLCDDGLMACPLSLLDPSKYFNIDFRIKVKRDIRTNKYAHDRSNSLGSDTDIMGSTSRNTQRTRMEMLRGIGVSLSI